MQTEEMLEMLDTEIARLTKARDLLIEVQAAPGLPGTKTAAKKTRAAKKAAPVVVKVKRGMSAEGKARIAAAQKKRWAAKRKAEAVTAKAPAKKSVAARKTVKKAAKKTAVKKSAARKAVPVAAPVETATPAA